MTAIRPRQDPRVSALPVFNLYIRVRNQHCRLCNTNGDEVLHDTVFLPFTHLRRSCDHQPAYLPDNRRESRIANRVSPCTLDAPCRRWSIPSVQTTSIAYLGSVGTVQALQDARPTSACFKSCSRVRAVIRGNRRPMLKPRGGRRFGTALTTLLVAARRLTASRLAPKARV